MLVPKGTKKGDSHKQSLSLTRSRAAARTHVPHVREGEDEDEEEEEFNGRGAARKGTPATPPVEPRRGGRRRWW